MKRIIFPVLFVLMVMNLLPDLASAQQGLPVDGKDFYIGFVFPSFNKNDGQQFRDFHGFYQVYALISSYEGDNLVKISYFDASGTEIPSIARKITAKGAIQVTLDWLSMKMTEPGDIPEYKSCHITAKKPVNVQFFSTGACSGGSYLAIPTPALGKSYVIASYNDNPGIGANLSSQAENAGGFFEIVAAFDGTVVQITPNGTTAGNHQGDNSGKGADGKPHPYNVSLGRGQCYWVKGDGSSSDLDMSGSTVVSNKPIAVLGGHEDAFIGDIGNRTLEARDFMIEQMIPSEYWDSTGYVSIPLKDATPTDPSESGYGENFRVYTNDPNGAQVLLDAPSFSGGYLMSASNLPSQIPEKDNVGTPVEFHSTDGHKFGVMLYDNRGQGSIAPNPAESMMSIVPMSRWRTSFLFYVPANTFEVLQNYYINLIALKDDIDKSWIKYTFNNGPLSPITLLSAKGFYTNIPNHPELKGIRYSVAPGAYYITNTRDAIKHPYGDDTTRGQFRSTPDQVAADTTTLHGAFMVYHYGMRAIDPDRDLGDFCGDDFFFSYALPIGMTVSTGTGNPTAKIDTLCSSWHVCVHDSVGIKSISLLDDSAGNVIRPGKKFFNARFDPKLDPDDKGEIEFSGDDTSVCVDVFVADPLAPAYVPLLITDAKGTHIDPLPELHYQAPKFRRTKMPDFPLTVDTLQYPVTQVGQQICSTLVYINTADSTGKTFLVSDAILKQNKGHFTITSKVPALPVKLKPGDSLKIQICFDAKDTLQYEDTVILQTDCFDAPTPIFGKGGTPLIYASDIDFGQFVEGTTLCKTLYVSNRGTIPFLLTQNWVLHNIAKFNMDPASAARLPHTLKPGDSIPLIFCYTPNNAPGFDSTSVDWKTDITPPYTDSIKSWSYLRGRVIKPGVIWDRTSQLDSVTCDDTAIVRVYLRATNQAPTHVTKVFLAGPDANEYAIVRTQNGNSGAFYMNYGDSLWFDIRFVPDLTKSPKYADRHSQLIATYFVPKDGRDDSTIINFTGKILHANLVNNPSLLDFGFVTKGVLTTRFVTVINNGDAPYVISSVNFPNPPIKGISLNGKALQPGDVIPRGDTVTLQIDGQLDTYTDTIVSYSLGSTKICSTDSGLVHFVATSLLVAVTGYPAPAVFVDCHEDSSSVTFTNNGSVKVTLLSVAIVSTPATPDVNEFDLKDATGNLTKTVNLKDTLGSGKSVSIPIIYHPSITGPVSATIRFNYDSAGKQFTKMALASGTGVKLKTTVTAANVGNQPYTAKTASSFLVPIAFATSKLPGNADVNRATFSLTYRRDVVDFLSALPGANYKLNVTPPIRTVSANNDETLTFDVTSLTGPIINFDTIIQVQYQVVVSKELFTPFTVSNVAFYDSKNKYACYVVTDTLPGLFVPEYLCGDTTLHNFLSGALPTRISALTPNVIVENETPVLFYSVNRSDVPIKVELFNVLGERVRTVKNTLSQPVGDYKLPVGVMGLPSGTYTVRLSSPVSSQTANFVLNR